MKNKEKKFDVIVVGELNVDLILNGMDKFPVIGKEVLSDNMNLTLGSSSAIFASNLSSLGASVAFVGKLGTDIFGDIILEKFREHNVDTSFIIRSPKYRTGATVVLNFDNDRANVTYPGAMEQLFFDDIPLQSLSQAKHLHFSSYFLQPALKKNIANLFSEAKKAGLTTSFDPQWDPREEWDLDIENILPYVDIFFPNEKELILITGKKNLEQAIDHLEPFSNTTALKRGEKGSVLLHKGAKIAQPAFINHELVDAIGAGDSFNAGFIYQFINDRPLEFCQRFGNLIGAISTTAPGGTGAFNESTDIYKIAKERFGYTEQ